MKAFVGTSGWSYDWNPEGLRWYVNNSRLNAIELNMSFYRFPFPNQVKGWAKTGKALRWVIKVHQSITHLRKLGDPSLKTWERFRARFNPMEEFIDLYLLQLPPSLSFNQEVLKRIQRFAESGKIAVEPRHVSWFTKEVAQALEEVGAVFVTPDSPMFGGLPPDGVYASRGIAYARLHGRESWYAHDYSEEELREVVDAIVRSEATTVYVFFNNDHWMLRNARLMVELLREAGYEM